MHSNLTRTGIKANPIASTITRMERVNTMNEHIIDEPFHAMTTKRLVMLERRHATRLALLIGKRAHEQRRSMRIANRIDDARHKQIRQNRREERARPKHDEVGFANRVERGFIGPIQAKRDTASNQNGSPSPDHQACTRSMSRRTGAPHRVSKGKRVPSRSVTASKYR